MGSPVRMGGTLDGGFSWFVVLGSFIQQFVVMGITNVFGLLYIDLLREFGESKATTAWIASISFGLSFIMGPFTSLLCTRFGCPTIAILGGILSFAGLLLSSAVDTIYQMYATYSLVFSIGVSFTYFSSMLALNQYFSKNLVLASGIALAGAGVGTAVISPLLNFFLDNYHWRDAMLILSGLSILLFLSGLILVLVPAPQSLASEDELKSKKKLLDFALLRNKAYAVWVVVVALILFGFYIPYVHLVRHSQDLGMPKQAGAFLVSYMAISQTIGKIIFGRIADHPRVNRIYLSQTCLLISSILTTLLPLFTSYTSLVTYCILFGFHDSCFLILISVLTADIAGHKNMAPAYGLMFFVSGFTMMLGPPVAGWMYEIADSYEPAFYMAGAFTALGVCLMFLIPWWLPREIEEEWRMRTHRDCVRVPSREASESTKTWILDCDSESQKSKERADAERRSLLGCAEMSAHFCDEKNKSISTGTLSYIIDKYFAIPTQVTQHGTHITQRDTQYNSLHYDENVWVPMVSYERETDV